MTTNHIYPSGVMTKLHTVRAAVAHIKGVHVEAYARGVIVSTRPNDAEGVVRMNRAHAALRLAGVTGLRRQAPNVIRIRVRRGNAVQKIVRD
jgi:hypothetical protein